MAKSRKPKAKARKVKKTVARGRAKPGKRAAKRRPAGKARAPVARPARQSLEKIGEVTHFFPHVKAAAVLMIKDGLKVGDGIYIKGHTTDFKERVKSIQLDHVAIQECRKGQEIGLLVRSRVRIGDGIYRL